MMALDITIPPAALEAGALAIAESLRTARLTTEAQDGYKPEARAAFRAMVRAWPGARERLVPSMVSGDSYCIILPMTEASDE